MAEYTVELRSICQWLAGNKMNDNSEEVIKAAAPLLFDFDFNFYDEDSKLDFEIDFLRHFYMREIGHETFGLWKHYLHDWLIVELPYYNSLFESAAIEYDPLEDVHYTRDSVERTTSETSTSGVSDSTVTTTGNATQKMLDTPQNRVANIENGYLSAATVNENGGLDRSHGESSDSGRGATTGNSIETVKGKMGMKGYAELVREQRENFINVKKMCFNAMDELFMQIY